VKIPGTNTYECDKCHGVFVFGWSDEDARAEADENGFDPDDDCGMVCDDCYQEIMGFIGEESEK
jgi:hypothetical protein